mmetsp:Transcript_17121/g.25308  ORF Transcript_17121/g.25308 Transcript_17121/m.25308 type:complete len:385 (+) Transcript_17121:118-1272(+)
MFVQTSATIFTRHFSLRCRWNTTLTSNFRQIHQRKYGAAASSSDLQCTSDRKVQESLSSSDFKRAKSPMAPFRVTPKRRVPSHIKKPPYAESGYMSIAEMIMPDKVLLHDEDSIVRMRNAARLARKILDFACSLATPGITTDTIDEEVHNGIIEHKAYPSPLNYSGFPKSVCSSINEVICHGIPDMRPLQLGDVVSFDVSCYLDGVHGDNCATIIVGDQQEESGETGVDWRGVPYRMEWPSAEDEARASFSRKLIEATREGLYAGINACRPGGLLSDIGNEIHAVADAHGFDTVEKYRGHGIANIFHTAPYVKHFRNNDKLELREGMIFTIEPMFTAGSQSCGEWADDWTVVTLDGTLAAQFEHTVLITDDGVEILTLPESEWS